jgi:tetratricopeptide (TPR) repeat protein
MAPAMITPLPADSASILTSWNKMREAFGFKVPVSGWYKDWRLLLMFKQTLDSSYQEVGNHNLEKFGERMLLEFLWFHIKKIISELTPSNNNEDFEFSKILNNKKRLFAELYGMEPLSYPHSLWFGILDLAESVCASSTRSITLSLCYYLALESLNHAPNTFVRFKAIEILLTLQHRRSDWFVVVDADLKECGNKFQDQKKSKFFGLVDGVKYKLVSKEKIMSSCGISNNLDDDFPAFTTNNSNQSNSSILSLLAQEMLCPVMLQITDQFYGLSCGHVISKGAFNIYKTYRSRKGKNLTCSICRKVINEESLTLLPQTSTLNALSDKFVAAGLLQDNISEYEISNPDTIMSELRDDIKKSKSLNNNPSNDTMKVVTDQLNHLSNPPDPLMVARECFKQNPQNPQKALLILDKTLQKSKAPLAYLERAKIYTHLSRFGEALLDVDNALQDLQDDDDNIEAYKLRAHLHFQTRKYKESLHDITIVINRIESYKINSVNEDYKYTSSDLEAYDLRGKIFTKLESYNEAIADFNIVVENDKFNSVSLANRGSLFREIRKYKESLEDLTKAIQLNPNFFFAKSQRGSVYCKLNKFTESLKDLEDVLNSTAASDDDKLFATAERGDLYCRQNMFNEALYDLDYVLAKNSNHVFAKSRRGYALFMLEKYEAALGELNEVLILDKTNYYSISYRGMVNLKLKNYNNSLRDFNIVLDRFPNNSVAIRQRAIVYFTMGKFEEALTDFDRLINLDTNDMNALCYRAEILYELGRYEDCIGDCNAILQYDSSNLIALRVRGMVLRKFGQNNEALIDLDNVLLRQPANAIALLERAAIYAALRQYPSSLADCEKILYSKPQQSIPYFQEITKVYGELSEAIGVDEIFIHLERVLQDSPKNVYVLTTRAYIYLLQWECDKAVKDLNLALRDHPNFVPSLYQRSIIYRITQDYSNALRDLEKILELDPSNSFAQTERNEIQSMRDFDRNQSHTPNYHNQPPTNLVSRRSSQTSVSSSSRSSIKITNNTNNTRHQ